MKKAEGKKLRIAQFITSQRSMPAAKGVIWAPIDLGLEIADTLANRGHQTTFYAPPSPSITGHKIISGNLRQGVFDEANGRGMQAELKKMPYGVPQVALFDAYLLKLMFDDAARGKYDLLHVHHERALPFIEHCPVPTVITLHDPINPFAKRAFSLFAGPKTHFVSISQAQRRAAPRLPYAATVYNGIDTAAFRLGDDQRRKRLLFCSRLVPQKGVEDAIFAAKASGLELDIVGRYYDRKYFDLVAKSFNRQIHYRGNIERRRLPSIYGQAKALLFPIKWEEPFGLVMIEAMACGTPVIAYDRGSVREVIKDGVTGFIVKDKRQLVSAIKKIDRLDPLACRAWVERKFSVKRMVDDYEELYLKLAR
ncbi:MAG: glycosyltransferase family 4 protein [Patescibacteria group bacterium]